MAVKISPEQIDRLYRFTREHFVYHYDIQTELVDHLCNDIEAQWEENPKLPFEEALLIAFKKFGVFGFQDVVEAKTKALEKKFYKILWSHFLQCFTTKKVWLFLGVFLILFQSLHWIQQYTFFLIIIAFVTFIITVTEVRFAKKRIQKQNEKTQRKYLFDEMLSSVGNGGLGIQIPIQMFIHLTNISEEFTLSLSGLLFWSALITLYLVWGYVVFHDIPANKEKYLKEVYPERFIHA